MKAIPSITLLLLTISLAVISAVPLAAGDTPTVYEVLQSYGFPAGLLPVGVTSYELDSSTGRFTVHLNKTCSFTIEGYRLRYRTTITGTISANRIRNLRGIQVRVLLFWLNIQEVIIDDDDLELSVGIASADFPVDSFYESPRCGCGFDCVNVGKKNTTAPGFGFTRFIPLKYNSHLAAKGSYWSGCSKLGGAIAK